MLPHDIMYFDILFAFSTLRFQPKKRRRLIVTPGEITRTGGHGLVQIGLALAQWQVGDELVLFTFYGPHFQHLRKTIYRHLIRIRATHLRGQ